MFQATSRLSALLLLLGACAVDAPSELDGEASARGDRRPSAGSGDTRDGGADRTEEDDYDVSADPDTSNPDANASADDAGGSTGSVDAGSPGPGPTPNPGTSADAGSGGTGGPRTDSTFLSYSNGKYTSQYHLYAAGLDWTKPVGLIVYGDGSGEYGLVNPNANYLLGGNDGLIKVAKRNNMVLLTPMSPNRACSDGDGACWYLGDAAGYAAWSAALITYVESRYPIAKNRVALGGYSSGAQWLTEFFAPGGHADDIMTDGVAVAISYGGSPKVSANFTAAFKANVHFNWNTGDRDSSYTGGGSYGVKAGHAWYTSNGFSTSLDLIPGLGHSRSDFGRVMEAQIKEHVPAQ